MKHHMDKYKHIGAEVSLYSGKTISYLRYKGIPSEDVLGTREVYQKTIIPRTGVKYIPVLVASDDVVIQDTTDIIDFLEARFPEVPVYPATPVQRLVALLFEVYGDEWLVIPAMYYRWCFKKDNLDFIVKEFGGNTIPDASEGDKRDYGERLAGYYGGMIDFLGITEKTSGEIEEWYGSFLHDFSEHLKNHPFLLGTRPSIGDFGLMGSLYAHLYRDPYPGRLMKSKAPLVAKWVERMNAPDVESGAFLPSVGRWKSKSRIFTRVQTKSFSWIRNQRKAGNTNLSGAASFYKKLKRQWISSFLVPFHRAEIISFNLGTKRYRIVSLTQFRYSMLCGSMLNRLA